MDAPPAVVVLRRSITELCGADHLEDAATLERWLSNKTAAHFRRWLADPESALYIAELEATIAGVGLVHQSGEIRLCYVSPDFQRAGAGRALLAALEEQARDWGLESVRLDSSRAALTFYARHGYVPSGAPTPGFGVTICHPHSKQLR